MGSVERKIADIFEKVSGVTMAYLILLKERKGNMHFHRRTKKESETVMGNLEDLCS